MDANDRLYFYYQRLVAVRRAQNRYLALLLAFLAFVWIFYWSKPRTAEASFFGMPIFDKSLLGITPALTTLLVLGLVGSQRALNLALQVFQEEWKNAGGPAVDLIAIDIHQNWVDYITFIWARPLDYMIYAAVLLGVIVSTFSVGLTLGTSFKGYESLLFMTYCILCLGLQAAATWKWTAEKLPILRRKADASTRA